MSKEVEFQAKSIFYGQRIIGEINYHNGEIIISSILHREAVTKVSIEDLEDLRNDLNAVIAHFRSDTGTGPCVCGGCDECIERETGCKNSKDPMCVCDACVEATFEIVDKPVNTVDKEDE